MWLTQILKLVRLGLWPIIWNTIQVWASAVGAEILLAGKEYAREALTHDGWSEEEREAFIAARLAEKSADGNLGWSEEIVIRAAAIIVRHVKANPADYLGKTGKLISRGMIARGSAGEYNISSASLDK